MLKYIDTIKKQVQKPAAHVQRAKQGVMGFTVNCDYLLNS